MRTIRFIVDKQVLTQDPNCDFSNLIPGTEGYLRAEFYFSREWNGCAKVAAFWSMMGTEYPAQLLTDGRSCIIPAEALKKKSFKVQVLGKSKNLKLVTNKLIIQQSGGNV